MTTDSVFYFLLLFFLGMLPSAVGDLAIRKVCSKEKKEDTAYKKIGVRDACAVLLGGLSAVLAVLYEGQNIWGIITLYAIFLLFVIISFIDLDTMLIHTASIRIFLALTIVSFFTIPHTGWVSRLIGAFCVSVPMLLLALCIEGAFGGGDIRLMWVGGLLLGWKLTLMAMFFSFLCGGAVAIKIMLFEKKDKKSLFAFGPYLCMGMVLALFFGDRVLQWYLGFFHR